MPSELREALTAAGASALVPKIIDPMLLEYQRRYSPLVRMVPSIHWESDTYYFNQRTTVASGGFVADGGARPVANSTYVQNSFQMKHLQSVGAITGYAQEVTRQVIGDLRAREIEGTIRGQYWDIETGILWGSSAATGNQGFPQFDGLDTLCSTFSGPNQNAINKSNAGLTAQATPLSLTGLDELIDLVEGNIAGSVFDDSWMFVMSSTAVSKLAQLQISQQRYTEVEAEVGLIVPTYRNIPLVKSSFLQPRTYAMGTVSTSQGTSTTYGTPSLPNATTYKYVVTAIVARQGEILPSTEVSVTTSAANSWISLSFATPTGLDGSQPISYKVYRTAANGSAGSETLLGYVDAAVGISATDGVSPIPTLTIVDTGSALVPVNGSTIPANLPSVYFGGNAGLTPPVGWNGQGGSATANQGLENVYLISRDQDNIVRPYVREMVPLDVYPTTASPDSLPYAVISDTTFALRAPKYAARLANVSTPI
jgi:hypothetical protein